MNICNIKCHLVLFFHRLVFKKHIQNRKNLLFDGRVCIKYGQNSAFILYDKLSIGYNNFGVHGKSTYIRLDDNSRFISTGSSRIFYGGDIYLFEGAEFCIGTSYINSNCFIRVTENVTIGNDCAISSNFTAMDSNFHEINEKLTTKPITIHDHVWIGANVTILPGVDIGEGAVVAAGSVVNKNVPAHCLVAGVPAKVIKNHIKWSM